MNKSESKTLRILREGYINKEVAVDVRYEPPIPPNPDLSNMKYETIYGRLIDVDNSLHQGVGNLLLELDGRSLELDGRPSEKNHLNTSKYFMRGPYVIIRGNYIVAIKVLGNEK